jgi:hypothetical protein
VDNGNINSHFGNVFVNVTKTREISGSHGGKYEDSCLLGCWAVAMMMEAASISETTENF